MTLFGTLIAAAFTALSLTAVEPVPTSPDQTRVITTKTTAVEFNAIISSAPRDSIIRLEKGTYRFTQPIRIARSDIKLIGSGSNRTKFLFDFSGSSASKNGIEIIGGSNAQKGRLTQNALRGTTRLVLQNGHDFKPGDAIHLSRTNTKEYLAANNWDNVIWEEARNRPFREQLNIINRVDGTVVTLQSPLTYDFTAGETQYFSAQLLQNVSISGIAISYTLGTPDKFTFENTLPRYAGARAISVNGTRELKLSDLQIINSASKGLYLARSIGANINKLVIRGSHNKGGKGNGYGVELKESFGNQIRNLEVFDMRHSVIFSAWHAETGNNIQIIDTNRDINFHGSPDRDNVVVVDRARQQYNSPTRRNVWRLVSAGGTNHAATDFLAENRVEFAEARASLNHDTIYASPDGAILDAGAGNDVLIGNTGDDVLIGGTRRDILTGGEGADRFVFRTGDDLDVITDFETGRNGDRIVFDGENSPDSFDDLALKQIGSNVEVRYGANSTIILNNTNLASLDAGNFEFNKLN